VEWMDVDLWLRPTAAQYSTQPAALTGIITINPLTATALAAPS
jgi:hypothetical protein